MRKYIFIIYFIFCSIFLILVEIPNYVELNDLIIVDSIGIDCSNSNTIYIKETIPIKSDNKINYKYKIYSYSDSNFNNLINGINDKISKKIYYDRVKKIYTNCSNDIGIKSKKIINTDIDIKKELNN